MLTRAIRIIVILLAGGLGIWALSIWSDAYRAHTLFFVILWLTLPALSFYAARYVASHDHCAARSLNIALVAVSVLLSFSELLNYEQIRDSIGKNYVSGYFAVHGIAYDDPRPDFYTDHWYSVAAMRAFEWLSIFAWFGLPVLTHKAVKRGNASVPAPSPPRITGRSLEFLQRQQAIRPTAKLEGIFFTNRDAWKYIEEGGRFEVIISNREEDVFLVFTNLPKEEPDEIERASRREQDLME